MSQRPFQVLAVQQIAIGAPNKAILEALWCDLLGLQRQGEFTSERENVDETTVSMGIAPHHVEIDLMQPLDATQSPRVDRSGLHHVGLWVDDINAAYSWLESKGVHFAPGGIRAGAGGHLVCFIHPKPSQARPLCGEGVLIELIQAPAAVLNAFLR